MVLGGIVRGALAWALVLLVFVPLLAFLTAQFALWGPVVGWIYGPAAGGS